MTVASRCRYSRQRREAGVCAGGSAMCRPEATMSKATRLAIDMSMWARAGADSKVMLKHPATGRMCCLGFYALACGVPEECIVGKCEYHEIDPSVAHRLL